MSKIQDAQKAIAEYRHLQDLVECCDKLIKHEMQYGGYGDEDIVWSIKTSILADIDVQRGIIRQFDPSFERGAE